MNAADASEGQPVTVADLRTAEVWDGLVVAVHAEGPPEGQRVDVRRSRDGLVFRVHAGFVSPRCAECGRAVEWDEAAGDYRHSEPAAPPCALALAGRLWAAE